MEGLSNLYDEYWSTPETADARLLPYLEGDYWIGEAENIIKVRVRCLGVCLVWGHAYWCGDDVDGGVLFFVARGFGAVVSPFFGHVLRIIVFFGRLLTSFFLCNRVDLVLTTLPPPPLSVSLSVSLLALCLFSLSGPPGSPGGNAPHLQAEGRGDLLGRCRRQHHRRRRWNNHHHRQRGLDHRHHHGGGGCGRRSERRGARSRSRRGRHRGRGGLGSGQDRGRGEDRSFGGDGGGVGGGGVRRRRGEGGGDA